MSHITMRISEKEKTLFESYARVQGISLTEAFKNALYEKLEDEYDLKCVREHEERKAKGFVKYYTHEEIVKELGLDNVL